MSTGNDKKSFISRVRSKEIIYLSCGFSKKRPTWHYVRVDPLKLPMFLRQAKAGSIDVAEYGEVLFSGWGRNPPDDIRRKIEETYA